MCIVPFMFFTLLMNLFSELEEFIAGKRFSSNVSLTFLFIIKDIYVVVPMVSII